MAGKKGMKEYPFETKLAVVKAHLEDGLTTAEVMKQYYIKNETQVNNWCAKYRLLGEQGLLFTKRGRPRKDEVKGSKPAEEPLWKKIQMLEMENDLLKKFLEEERRWLRPELPTK